MRILNAREEGQRRSKYDLLVYRETKTLQIPAISAEIGYCDPKDNLCSSTLKSNNLVSLQMVYEAEAECLFDALRSHWEAFCFVRVMLLFSVVAFWSRRPIMSLFGTVAEESHASGSAEVFGKAAFNPAT